MRSSVVSPMADTTTTTWRPPAAALAMRCAAARIRSAVASDNPPYFWTRSRWDSVLDNVGSCLSEAEPKGAARHVCAGGRGHHVVQNCTRGSLVATQSQDAGSRAGHKGAQRASRQG